MSSLDLADERYISFGSFRADGTLVATPTWVVPFRGGYAFTTQATSFKVGRITRNPEVAVSPCDVRGRVRDGTVVQRGQARLLEGDEVAEVQRLVKAKYRLGWLLLIAPGRAWAKLRGRPEPGAAAIAFSF